MRHGKWQLSVLVDGEPLKEHEIDGHTCVTSLPGREFSVLAEHHGTGLFQVEVLIDGKKVAARRGIDCDHATSRPSRSYEAKGWEKSEGGSCVTHSFKFEKPVGGGEDQDEDESRPAGRVPVWERAGRGSITLRAYFGTAQHVAHDSMPVSHRADLSKAAAVSEVQAVKDGLGASAGKGETKFTNISAWRAGEVCVGRAEGDPLAAEVTIFYRDSFFMLLHEDTCRGGRCSGGVGERSSAALGEDDEAEGCSSGVKQIRARVRETFDTTQKLAKRPKGKTPVVIDLCDSD